MATNNAVPLIESAHDLEQLVLKLGLLSLVPCGLTGLSVKEYTPANRWFAPDTEGPWEWRETVAAGHRVAYGRLLGNKAGFISPSFFGDFANWRRKGMDFDDRYADGMVSRMEKQIMDMIRDQGPLSTRALRAAFGKKGLDCAIGSLQMRTDLLVCAVDYRKDAFGRPYGMGATVLAPAEMVLGEAAVTARFDEDPACSYERLYEKIAALSPDPAEKALKRLLF